MFNRFKLGAVFCALTVLALTATAHSKSVIPGEPSPVAVQSQKDFSDKGAKNGRPTYEKRYLNRYEKFAKEFGERAPGRNIVLWGVETKSGDVRDASKRRVKESTAYMRDQLNPPEVVVAERSATAPTAAGSYDTSGAPTSVIECESGGDYGAVNPAGYYGAYQFDQSTWDAYAPEGWAGVNPAQAPPEVQDAAAAAVDYDAWPSC